MEQSKGGAKKMSFRKISLALCAVVLGLALVACEKEGPAEKMGKEVDKAAEKTGQAMEKAADAVKETAKEAADKVEKAVK
jgi:outer membrane PBP1 activator LpoA protein